MVHFKAWTQDGVQVISFEIDGGVMSPSDLPAVMAAAPAFVPECGVIIDGRGPVWLYAALSHHYHPSRWVATRDPRLGAVVVETHTPGVGIGDIVSFPSEG